MYEETTILDRQIPVCIRVRRMLEQDIDSVVRLHTESFPGFFLSSLGPGFLRLVYRAILKDANGIALVAERLDAIVGFACGSSASQGFYWRLVKRQWWEFGWAATRVLVCRPSKIRHFVGAIRARVVPRDTAPAAELMSLATSPGAQRQGIGKDLVIHFLYAARRSGASRVTLTTGRQGNDQVNSFYRQLGFTLANSFLTNTGREMNLYEIKTLIIPTVG